MCKCENVFNYVCVFNYLVQIVCGNKVKKKKKIFSSKHRLSCKGKLLVV